VVEIDMASQLASFLASLVPVLVAIKVAKDRRGNCYWPLNKAKSQIWVSVMIILASQVVVFAPAQPFSPLALLSILVEAFGVYRLSRAIYRKRDLAKAVSSDNKTTKLNGWKRIGIVASTLWILGAGSYVLMISNNAAVHIGSQTTLECEGYYSPGGPTWSSRCDQLGMDAMNRATDEGRLDAALVAFVPVPLGWGFVYLILFLVRWIKRGFVQPEAPLKRN
jgi:hypothetical protein